MNLSSREVRRGYRLEPRAVIPCIVAPDGLLIFLDYSQAASLLDVHYPSSYDPARGTVWYFNSTRDREIAEQDGDRICANPQILWQHLLGE